MTRNLVKLELEAPLPSTHPLFHSGRNAIISHRTAFSRHSSAGGGRSSPRLATTQPMRSSHTLDSQFPPMESLYTAAPLHPLPSIRGPAAPLFSALVGGAIRLCVPNCHSLLFPSKPSLGRNGQLSVCLRSIGRRPLTRHGRRLPLSGQRVG